MFKLRKFKSSFNVYNGTTKGRHHEQISYGTSSLTGAYRINRNEFSSYGNYSENKVTDAATVRPPLSSQKLSKPVLQTKSSKDVKDVVKKKNLAPSIPQAQAEVSSNPLGSSEPIRNSREPPADPNNGKHQLDAYKRVEKKRLEEQKKLEKKRLEEQKKLEKKRLEEQKQSQKLALQEQVKQEKLRKEREKKEAQQSKKDKKIKKTAPQRPLANPLAQVSSQSTSNPIVPPSAAPYSSNTLNSSISKTSGPPPYTEVPKPEGMENETNSNVKFKKPEDPGSWDLVSQHRQNVIVNKHANPTQTVKGQTKIDLNYTLGEGKSDA